MTPNAAPTDFEARYLTAQDLPIKAQDEADIAERWALVSSREDLRAAIQGARKEAHYSIKLVRALGQAHQSAYRNAALKNLQIERLRCRIATTALGLLKQSKSHAVVEVAPDRLLRSIEPMGWTSTEFKRLRHVRPVQTVTKDYVTAVGPKAATITATRSPASGEIRFQCEFISEGRNILATLSPTIPMGTSGRGAKATLNDLLVTVERSITESYAGKLLRKCERANNLAAVPTPDADSRQALRPKRKA